MEPKKEQIVRFFARVSKAVQTWWPWLMDLGLVVLIVLALSALMGCRSTTAAYGTQHTTRDSVAVRYKTVLRDSIRIKDSVRIVTKTKVRDSVVLRIDNNTGNIVSREAWHWQDTDNSRDHLTDVGKMVSKADSVGTERIKKDSAVIISKAKDKPAEVKKTHYWKTWWFGVLCGISISLCWKYRKTIIDFTRHRIV